MRRILAIVRNLWVDCSIWFRDFRESHGPARRLVIVDGDSLPQAFPRRNLVLARDGNEDWCVGMKCPCGCDRTIELLVFAEAKPRWSVAINDRQQPTLSPSVWLQTGCRSHFWVRSGRVIWSTPRRTGIETDFGHLP